VGKKICSRGLGKPNATNKSFLLLRGMGFKKETINQIVAGSTKLFPGCLGNSVFFMSEKSEDEKA
jgi:hypothetical protein